MTERIRPIAVLFAEKNGPYSSVHGVDLWDAERDARQYCGPYPVIAHPPCSSWCQLAGLNQHRYGHKIGNDDGCFESALSSVRQYGGVLEHPAYSKAWGAFGLPIPANRTAWQRSICGAWVCYVEQNLYGHEARKATWLYAYNIVPEPIKVGIAKPTAVVSGCKNRIGHGKPYHSRRLQKRSAYLTPDSFRDFLVRIARSSYDVRH